MINNVKPATWDDNKSKTVNQVKIVNTLKTPITAIVELTNSYGSQDISKTAKGESNVKVNSDLEKENGGIWG